MRTRLKVCCIASEAEAAMAVAAGADALGLVGAMPSGPGVIEDEQIARVAASTPPPIATFLLTSETDPDAIADHVRRAGASAVQVVSHIEPGAWSRIAEREPFVRRVQVIHVEDERALALFNAYAPRVHAFLLDSGRPSLPTPELGGTGRVHDWAVSAEFVRLSPRPVFLAGGLTAANVAEAIRTVRPFGVDFCSGVRTDGRLDADKLKVFVAAARSADAELDAD